MLRECLGLRIRQARLEADLSGTQLARLIGKSQPYISDLERGQRTPSLQTLQAIAAALGKPTSYFLEMGLEEAAASLEASAHSKPSAAAGPNRRLFLAAGYVADPEKARCLSQVMASQGIQSFIFRSPREIDREEMLYFLKDLLDQCLDRLDRIQRKTLDFEDLDDLPRARAGASRDDFE